jgi:hypothetical protein
MIGVNKRSTNVADNEIDDATERKLRLQALRNAQKDGIDNTSEAGSLKKIKRPEGGGEGDRKREFVKKLLQKRMQEGAGSAVSGQGSTGRKNQFRRKALMNQDGKDAISSGEGLDQFPRLKAMLEQRRNQGKGASTVPVEELEERVTRLESALEETRKKIEDAKSEKEGKLQVVSSDSAEEGKS